MFPWMVGACRLNFWGIYHFLEHEVIPELWFNAVLVRRLWTVQMSFKSVTAAEALELYTECFPGVPRAEAQELCDAVASASPPVFRSRLKHFLCMNQDSPARALHALSRELLHYDAVGKQCHKATLPSLERVLRYVRLGSEVYADKLRESGVKDVLQLHAVLVRKEQKTVDLKDVLPADVSGALVKAMSGDPLIAGAVYILYRDALAQLLQTAFWLDMDTAWSAARELTDASGRSDITSSNFASVMRCSDDFADCVAKLKAAAAIT